MPPVRTRALLSLTLLGALHGAAPQAAGAAELATLFTTPQERQIINSNRYKTAEPKPVAVTEIEEVADQPIQQLMMEEVAASYSISGITLSAEGTHMVWINNLMYENGAKLEDKSRVDILVGDELRVRITTPDGKQHFGTSGETLEVTYLAPIEN